MHDSYSNLQEDQKKNTSKTISIILTLLLVGAIVAVVVLAIRVSKNSSDSSSTGNLTPAQEVQKNVTEKMLSAIDKTVNPCEDFYLYACGNWIKNTQLPADKSRLTKSLDSIEESNELVLREILESDMDWPLIAPYYRSCMNTTAIDQLGVSPLDTTMVLIDSITDLTSLVNLIGTLHANGVSPFWTFTASADLYVPSLSIGQLYQGGQTLPDPSLYNEAEGLREPFVAHVSKMLQFLGDNKQTADTNAGYVWDIESSLANASLDSVAQRDINGTYNRLDLQGLQALDSTFPWITYFKALGFNIDFTSSFPINIQTIHFTKFVMNLIKSNSAPKTKAYLRWYVIHSWAGQLSSPVVAEDFAFFGKILSGAAEQSPRWKTCVSTTDRMLGHILGRYYVQEKFSENSRRIATDIMNRIIESMKEKIQIVSWMDDTKTRDAALLKLSQFHEQIGWPLQWEQYAGLNVPQQSFIGDSQVITTYLTKVSLHGRNGLGGVGGKVDVNAWGMTPQTVNAYYEPSMNHIVIPAGIMQGFIFNEYHHPLVNFATIGAIAGHEGTHGFDDQGAQYDGTGKFTNWWSPSVLANWNERTTCLADFYSKYEPLPGKFLNGRLTLGENIADLGGLKQSYRAYKSYMNSKPTLDGVDLNKPYIEGYNNEQAFFLSFANLWCTKQTDQSLRNQIASNPHSPGHYRVNGPLSNFPLFGETFQCKKGVDPMYPATVCDVW